MPYANIDFYTLYNDLHYIELCKKNEDKDE